MAPMVDHWHISSLEVKAFKSFGPAFSTFKVPCSQLVGVVGPNGCGKSNLLEAICFAAAGSTSVLRTTGRSLQDATSTDAGSQRPEVRLHISQGKATYVLEACLTAEGARSYKIDGKNRTGTQVKDFLKARGIVVDRTTVIQQADVTQLSDNNNAQALAQLVAAASGLNSWNQETATARQEITRTHKALQDIQSNIKKVQASVASEDAAFKAAAEAAQLEAQLEQQLQELMAALQQRQQQLGRQLLERQAAEQELQGAEVTSAESLRALASQRKALATQAAAILAQLDSHSSSGGSNAAQPIAAAQAQAASLQASIAARAQWAAELEQKQQLLQQQDLQCLQLQQRVAERQLEAAGLSANLAAARSSTDAAAALQRQAQEASMHAKAAAATVQQQQEAVTTKELEVQHADSKAQSLLQQWQACTASTTAQSSNNTAATTHLSPSTAAEVDCAVTAAGAAAAAAVAAAASHMQQLQGLQQQHVRLQMQVQAAAGPLTPPAIGSLLAALGDSNRALPLHACFKLRDAASLGMEAQQLEQLLLPLSVIAGPAVMQTLVAPTVSEANRLLEAAAAGAGSSRGGAGSRRLKIWPLDNLTVQDMQRQQRVAQQQLGSHAVTLPLDLLDAEAAYRPALLRAFGGFVIAADDATAAALVERFGLSAVTLQGTVSRRGTMSGGWTGSSGSHARAWWGNKQRHDQAAQQLATCKQQLATCKQQLGAADTQTQVLLQQRSSAEAALLLAQRRQQLLLELQEAQAEAAAAQAALEQEQLLLAEQQGRSADMQKHLQQYQAALGGSEVGSGTGQAKGKGKGSKGCKRSDADVLQQQLQADLDKAAADVAAAEQQLEEAQEKADELSVCIEALECRLSGTTDPQQQQKALQDCLQTLQQLQQQEDAAAAATQALRENLQQLEQQQAQLDKQLKASDQQLKAAQKQAAQAAAATKDAASEAQKLQQEAKQIAQEFRGTDAVQANFSSILAPAAPSAASAATAAANAWEVSQAQLQQLRRLARQLQARLSRLAVPELLPGQKEALTARLAQVTDFNQQSDALKAAAAGLEAQMAQDEEQVYAANDVVFEDIAAGFAQLCSSLLPSLELQLVRVGGQAHKGLQFRFRRLEDAAATDKGADSNSRWHTNLGQLSGGQRTLVSMAMLLAVARTGSACGLLLLDEVDAALDEVNQSRASALLRQLAHDKASACQVLCVTHNASFQESCDGFVRVTKSASGHSVPAEPGGDAQVTNPAAAAGAAAGGRAGGAGQKDQAGGRKGGKQGRAAAAAGAQGVLTKAGPSRRAAGGGAKRVRFAE